jgi:hypothetical protein
MEGPSGEGSLGLARAAPGSDERVLPCLPHRPTSESLAAPRSAAWPLWVDRCDDRRLQGSLGRQTPMTRPRPHMNNVLGAHN